MITYNVFSLGDYKFRRLNLIAACIFLLLDVFIHIAGISHLWKGFLDVHVVIHFFLLIGLVSAALSKEKIDDERSQMIRYATFKLTLSMLVCIGAVIVYMLSFFKIQEIPLLPVLYFFELSMVFYLLFTFIAFRRNPGWIFKEPTSPKVYFRLMLVIYISITVLLIFIAIISGIIK
jgi:hypothetical protein